MADEKETDEGERWVTFELTAYWLDYYDRATGLPVTMTPTVNKPSDPRSVEIAPPFRGSYAQCAVRANEILSRLPPMGHRWVPLFGTLPKLSVSIDTVDDGR